MRRLLVFTENYARGGGNRYLIDLINAGAREFESTIVAANPGGLFPEDIRRLRVPAAVVEVPIWNRARLHHALAGLPRSLRAVPLLVATLLAPVLYLYNMILFMLLIRRTGVSAVFACNGGYPAARATLAMAVASRLMGRATILSIVSMPKPRKVGFTAGERLLDMCIWRCVSVVIVNARAIAEALKMSRDMPAGKCSVVYNGLEGESAERGESHERRMVVIGCIARMDRTKGVLYLLEAFGRIADTAPAARLILVGHGDASEEIARRVTDLGLGDRVELKGYYDGEVKRLLAGIDIYVFPSLHEGFPYSILEAMRSGCAIVATRAGGIPEAIREGEEGLIVAPGSIDALESAIRKLLIDEGLRERVGLNARTRFLRYFTLDAMDLCVKEVLSAAGLADPGCGDSERQAVGKRVRKTSKLR